MGTSIKGYPERLEVLYMYVGSSIFCVCKQRVRAVKSALKTYVSYFSNKTYVVGTENNRLNETVLLGNQNIC